MTTTELEVTSIEIPPQPLLASTFIHNLRHTAHLKQNLASASMYFALQLLHRGPQRRLQSEILVHTTQQKTVQAAFVNETMCRNIYQSIKFYHFDRQTHKSAQKRKTTATVWTSDGALELTLLIDSKLSKIRLNVDKFQCEIKTSPIHGCYKRIKWTLVHRLSIQHWEYNRGSGMQLPVVHTSPQKKNLRMRFMSTPTL